MLIVHCSWSSIFTLELFIIINIIIIFIFFNNNNNSLFFKLSVKIHTLKKPNKEL